MKPIFLIYFTVALLGLVKSCETTEKIDDFPLRHSRLVLNSYFTPDSAWEFQVSKSLSVLDNDKLRFVDNAMITLYRDSELIDSIKGPDDDGWYRSDSILPVSGEKYSIEVRTPDFKNTLYAEDMVPLNVPVAEASVSILDSFFRYDNPRYTIDKTILFGRAEGFIEILISDPVEYANFYRLTIFTYFPNFNYYDSIFNYYKRNVFIDTDDASITFSDGRMLFEDKLFNGKNHRIKLNFNEWEITKDQIFFIELNSLSESAYLYETSVSEYKNASGDPFSEPVLIYDNIVNGYGIFAGYATTNYGVPVFE
ncbi:MAG: DUF4249 domain-containing protein [Bacteroidales bacterium]